MLQSGRRTMSSSKNAVVYGVSLVLSLGVSYVYYRHISPDDEDGNYGHTDDKHSSGVERKPTPENTDVTRGLPSSSPASMENSQDSMPAVNSVSNNEAPHDHDPPSSGSPTIESPSVRMNSEKSVLELADEYYAAGLHQRVYALLKKAATKSDSTDMAHILWRLARACNDQKSNPDVTAADKEAFVNEGLAHAQRALRCDPDLAQPHKWCAILTSGAGDFKSTKEQIQGAFLIRDFITAAIERDPHDPTSEHVYGQWCFAFASMGWATRRVAAAIFGTPPTSTYEEALQHFKRAEEIEPGFYKLNSLKILECHQVMRSSTQVQRGAAEAVLEARVTRGGATQEDTECDAKARKFLGR